MQIQFIEYDITQVFYFFYINQIWQCVSFKNFVYFIQIAWYININIIYNIPLLFLIVVVSVVMIHFHFENWCYGLNCVSPESTCEALNSNICILGDGVIGRYLVLFRQSHGGEACVMGFVPSSEERANSLLTFPLSFLSCPHMKKPQFLYLFKLCFFLSVHRCAL